MLFAGNIQFFLNTSWKSVDKRFQVLLARFQHHRKSVEKEAEASHLLEEGKARDSVNDLSSQVQKQNTGHHHSHNGCVLY